MVTGAAVSVPSGTPVGYVTKATVAAVTGFEEMRAAELTQLKQKRMALKEQCHETMRELRRWSWGVVF
jgi:hypothetical protein